jgi:hypothetical protein
MGAQRNTTGAGRACGSFLPQGDHRIDVHGAAGGAATGESPREPSTCVTLARSCCDENGFDKNA